MYLGREGIEKNFVASVFQGGDRCAQLGEVKVHANHSLGPSLPLVVFDGQLFAWDGGEQRGLLMSCMAVVVVGGGGGVGGGYPACAYELSHL